MSTISLRIQKINLWLNNLNRITYVLIIALLLLSFAFIFNSFLDLIKQKDIIIFKSQNDEKSIIFLFLTTIIIAPIVETFLGQSLPYFLLRKVKYFRERNLLVLLTSSFFFGVLHFYSIFYIVYAFFLGLILMFGYMVRIINDNKTFLLITICHSLLNLAIFIKNLT